MYRYIKTNESNLQETIHLKFLVDLFVTDLNISASEYFADVDDSVYEEIFSKLDKFADDVVDELRSNYFVFVGEPKPNKAGTSEYIAVSLRDSSVPYRLSLELEYFSRITRVSNHRNGKSKAVEDARNTSIFRAKKALKDNVESLDRMLHEDSKLTEERTSIIDNYSYPEDLSVVIRPVGERLGPYFDTYNMCVKYVADLTYSKLLELNGIDKQRNDTSSLD